QRRAHRQLVGAGPFYVAGDAVQLRPGSGVGPDAFEPRRAALEDVPHAHQRLHVVDDGRTAEHAVDGRKRRLDARMGTLALERFDQAGLFAADVRAGAAMHVDVELARGAENVLAEKAFRLRFGDRLEQHVGAESELTANVDVRVD